MYAGIDRFETTGGHWDSVNIFDEVVSMFVGIFSHCEGVSFIIVGRWTSHNRHRWKFVLYIL